MSTSGREDVRAFLGEHFAEQLHAVGAEPSALGDDFDLLIEGVMDSLGLLTLVTALEERFGVALDLESLDADDLTKVGPLCTAVAEQASG